MNIWILISIVWASFLLFMIYAPNKWHAFVLKENTFWLNKKIISKSFFEKMVAFETGRWLKVLTFIGLLPMIYLSFLQV